MDLQRLYKSLNILGLLIVLTVNTLANVLPINGLTTGEVSERYGNLFVPAGFTFSIWALIYLLLLAFTIYQARGLFADRRPAGSVVWDIGPWFFLSCLANSAWIFAWHYEWIGVSVILMLLLLFSLIRIYLGLDIGQRRPALGEKYLVHLPFSVYLGWIMVATIANFSAWFTSLGWQGEPLSPNFWAAVMIGTAAALGIWFLLRRNDVPVALVICWALTGILVKRINTDWEINLAVLVPLSIALALLLVITVLRFGRYFSLVNDDE